MKVLVTGGAGFLGSHLVGKLLELDHQVVALDNLHTGRLKNLESFFKNKKFEFVHHDVQNPILMEVDGIFNLACPASPVHYQINPIKTVRTNVEGAINVLELAHKLKIRVLQASTSEVYGNPKVNPQTEKYWGNVNPIGIRSCYDEGKRVAETLFMDYKRQYGTDIRIARIFNTYGPKMTFNDGRVVSNFVSQAIQNKPITLYGEGIQIRSFCYVTDLIEGLIKLFFSNYSESPINLGNPNPVSINELAEKIITLTKSSSKIIFQDLPSDDPELREPDITLATNLLGWSPKIELNSGLRETIRYFRGALKK